MEPSGKAKDGCKDNFDEIELTEGAWGKEVSGKFQNHFISVSPPFLKFPYDDPKHHEYKITIWNKTNRILELDVEVPRCGVFQVFHNKGILFGGSVSTMIVRCDPQDIQFCTDFIRIGIVNQAVKPLIIPLELFPSVCWFSLPRIIVIPSVSLGKQIETRITLPSPHSEGRYYFIIKVLTDMDCFSVSPARGFLKSGSNFEGVRKIIVKYTPLQYTTQVYSFQIIFPEMPSFHPYEVNVYTRCTPNSESNAIRMATDELEKLILTPRRMKTPELRLIFPPKTKEDDTTTTGDTNKLDDDLFTPAGIVRFLSKKGGKVFENRRNVGPLGLTTQQEQKIYKDAARQFHIKLNRVEIHQKNLVLQHNKAFLGQDSIMDDAEGLQAIKEEEDRHIREYELSIGLIEKDTNDLTRDALQASQQRCIRNFKDDFNRNVPQIDNEMIAKDAQVNSRWAKKIAQRRFFQAALVIITRRRCARRIKKLRHLIEETNTKNHTGSNKSKKKFQVEPGLNSQ